MAKPLAFLASPKGPRPGAYQPLEADAEAQEAIKDAQDLAEMEAREDARKAQDQLLIVAKQKKLAQLYKLLERPHIKVWSFPWLGKMLPSKVWRRFQVTRYYMSEKTVIDLFESKAEYALADVELRRQICKDHGLRYGALGRHQQLEKLIPQLFGEV